MKTCDKVGLSFLTGIAAGWFLKTVHSNVGKWWNSWRSCRAAKSAIGSDLSGIELILSNGRDFKFNDDGLVTFVHVCNGPGSCPTNPSYASLPHIHWLADWVRKRKGDFQLVTIWITEAGTDFDQLEQDIVANHAHKLAFFTADEYRDSGLQRRLRLRQFPAIVVLSPDNIAIAQHTPQEVFNNVDQLFLPNEA